MTCSKCGKSKTEDEMYKGLRCKDCRNEYSRNYYATNKESHLKLVLANNKKYVARNRLWLYEYLLEHSCVDCGEDDPIVLEFDHLRDKEAEISKLKTGGVALQRLKDEIAKCDVVCANCHKRRTAQTQSWFKSVRPTLISQSAEETGLNPVQSEFESQ